MSPATLAHQDCDSEEGAPDDRQRIAAVDWRLQTGLHGVQVALHLGEMLDHSDDARQDAQEELAVVCDAQQSSPVLLEGEEGEQRWDPGKAVGVLPEIGRIA